MGKVSIAVLLAVMLSGCAVSPSIPILGAFFPGWLLCAAAALFVTLVLRAVLIKAHLAESLGPPVLVYPLITAIGTLLFWILFFHN
ncbi:conserved membrane hypothetical protein [uncultured delta proteobacterium]|uniref:Uncharacterized protein YtcA n=1 Tax=uncultured delta proteobacterium TaxID=34034 RepID=A0A212JAW9_9DELT|nr:conserved membrane hypothetical protein [uncultured delta proteobacterium]